MTVLVVGAGGLLGSNVATQPSIKDDVVGTYHTSEPSIGIPTRRLDVRDSDAVEQLVDEVAPDTVVNCAAMTDVDSCESSPEKAHAVNAAAPEHLASLCSDHGLQFVHVSTDYVFDGESESPYPEDASTNPIQEYGVSKLAGERAVRETDSTSLIVRLSFVYGIHRGTEEVTGFPAWVLSRLRSGEQTPLFTDQQVTPSRAGQAASTILSLIHDQATGIIHVACRSCVTPYEFGNEIRRRIDASEELITQGSMEAVDRAASRPRNTCLDISRLEKRFGSQPPLESDLDAIAESFLLT